MTTIIVGVDGSTGASHALKWALRQAEGRNETVEVVHVAQHMAVPAYVAGRAGGLPGPSDEQREETGAHLIEEMLAAVPPPAAVQVTRTVLLSDNPAKALVAHAAGAGLLVLGSRGLSGFQGLLLGSVSQQCVTHASCPVVVVPPPEAA